MRNTREKKDMVMVRTGLQVSKDGHPWKQKMQNVNLEGLEGLEFFHKLSSAEMFLRWTYWETVIWIYLFNSWAYLKKRKMIDFSAWKLTSIIYLLAIVERILENQEKLAHVWIKGLCGTGLLTNLDFHHKIRDPSEFLLVLTNLRE